MKKISEINRCIDKLGKQISVFLAFMFVSTVVLAQRAVEEKDPATAEFNYDMRDNPWYTQPWIWAIVASVLILLIAFISKGNFGRHGENDSEPGTAH